MPKKPRTSYIKVFSIFPELLVEMLHLYSKGESALSLSNKYNVDHSSILYQIKKHNVKRGVPVRDKPAITQEARDALIMAERIRYLKGLESPYEKIITSPVNEGHSYGHYLKVENKRHKPIKLLCTKN